LCAAYLFNYQFKWQSGDIWVTNSGQGSSIVYGRAEAGRI
jgi:hypothetical protein